MYWWEAALWGSFGGFALEASEFSSCIRRTGSWPWRLPAEPSALAFGVSVAIRLIVSTGLTVAAAQSGQVQTVFAALTTGLAAPLIVEQLARQVMLRHLPDGRTPVNGDSPVEPAILLLPDTPVANLSDAETRGRVSAD